MAIALRSTGTEEEGNNVQTIEVPAPAGIVDGDFLFMRCYASNDEAITTPEAGWTKEAEQQSAAAGDNTCAIFWKIASSESGTYTVDISGGLDKQLYGYISALTGVDASTPFDVTTVTLGDDNNNDSPDPPAITPVTDGCWIYTVVGAFGISGASQTEPSGYTAEGIAHTTNHHLGSAYKLQATAAAEDPGVWTSFGTGADCSHIVCALRPAGAGGGGGIMPLLHSQRMLRSL